jgi:diguanylate cyclase (GGDEF)-like protein/PAS domain S-box-containing protein
MTTPPAKAARQRFFSLKWKALFFLSLVLAVIHGGFTVFQYVNLKHRFDTDVDTLHTRNERILAGLFQQSANRLQQLGGMIPSLNGMEQALAEKDAGGIERAFSHHWPTLEFDLNVEGVGFYDSDDRLLSAWGSIKRQAHDDRNLGELALRVNRTERPATIIDCSLGCVQYTAVPLLVAQQHTFTILLSTSLADVIIDFSNSTNVNAGVVVTNSATPAAAAGSARFRPLPEWDARVVGLTRATTLYPVLTAVSARTRLEQLVTDDQRILIDGKSYDVWAIPLEIYAESGQGYLVLINDISDAIAAIQRATDKAIVLGLVGLLASEAVLLLVLWTPLSRLRRTAVALPLLARSAFTRARSTIQSHGSRFIGINDEIDQLDESVVDLSYQLEHLESVVAQRSHSLAEKMDELTRDRDFIRGLLDTAQVLVLTQTRNGTILLANRYAETMTGYSQEDLLAHRFSDLITADSLPVELAYQLDLIASGRSSTFQHESTLRCKDDQERVIAWLHGRLDVAESGSAVLTVGLDITDRKNAESRLAWLASHDPLTGLFNRRRFQEEFEVALKMACRHARSGALLFLDLDNFKYINDTSGHPTGDAIIKVVSAELAKMHRETDIVARLGGDEFGIVMSEVSAEDACELARKVNEHLNQLVVPTRDRPHKVSVSIGIAMFPEHGAEISELLANADIAMYQAKERGRGGWHLFSEEERVRERLREHVYWRERIAHALDKDRFVLYYQPILEIRTGMASHHEVLLRMRDDDDSLLPPGAFIEIAEKTGQIHAIDHWVLRNAIASLAEQLAAGFDLRYSINLSAHAFMDRDLLDVLRNRLDSCKVPADRLVFEITETAALSDFTATCNLMDQIRQLGCKFALDDFGVGFSSFYYLKQLPVDYIKIDGSFIRDLARNADDRILVKAIGEIAHGFGKKTVAEFVENAETLELLNTYGIDYAQGYHIGRPAPRPIVLAGTIAEQE